MTVNELNSQTWFLILIDVLSMLYTILAVVASWKLENWDIKLEFVMKRLCIISHKIMLTLIELKMTYLDVDLTTLNIFFLKIMSQNEQAFWNKTRTYFKRKNSNKKTHFVNSKAASCMQMLNEKMKQLSSEWLMMLTYYELLIKIKFLMSFMSDVSLTIADDSLTTI